MVLLWSGTFALTASPALHQLFHPDSQTQDHNCPITQLKQFSLLTGVAPVVVPSELALVFASPLLPEFQFVPTADLTLSPSRGPPLVSLLSIA